MLAEMVDHVIGVDPDRDWITAAVVDSATTGVVATARFVAKGSGYREAMAWADEYSTETERAWAVEGTSSYGRGIAVALANSGEWVIEFDRAKEKAAKRPRTERRPTSWMRFEQPERPWAVTGGRRHVSTTESVRRSESHVAARDSAVHARTAAINELKAFVVTAPDHLRDQLRGLKRRSLVKRCAGFRHSDNQPIDEQCTRAAMRAVARRIIQLTDEIKAHEKTLRLLVAEAAPQLLGEFGIGPITAAALYVAWSHPGRCRNEAAYARLAGVAPIPANSGQTQDRHRLNRGGDRQLNTALHTVAVTRIRAHPPTQDYKQRRLAEGKTDREIRRCIKRYIARRVFRLLENPPLEKAA